MRRIEIAGLNISMHNPHSPQGYVGLFSAAYRLEEVVPQGELHALMLGALYGAKNGVENNQITGEIYRFVKVDANEPWFDLKTRKQAQEDEVDKINIPDHLLAHMQRMPFVFHPKTHTLFYVAADRKAKLGPQAAERFFQRLFDRVVDSQHIPSVEVTAIPDYDELDSMLNTYQLSKLVMQFKRPNPDDAHEFYKRFTQRMEAQGIKTINEELIAAGEEGLMPDRQTRKELEVAATNGSVRVIGKDASGQRVDLSTTQRPMKIFENLNEVIETVWDLLQRSARDVTARILKRRK